MTFEELEDRSLLDGDPALVRIRMEVTDLAGNVISSVPHGNYFLIQGFVDDLRTGFSDPDLPRGVAAAFLDVNYDPTKVYIDPAATIVRNIFSAQALGDPFATPGLIDEVGGINPTTTLTGPNELMLFQVVARAMAQGTFFLDADAADVPTGHDTIIYVTSAGAPSVVPISQIQYVDSSTITITPAIELPTISINDVTVTEGNTGNSNLVATVSVSSNTQDVAVAYQTGAAPTGPAATAGSDYNPTSGTLTFPAGTTTRTITVQVRGDTTAEPDEYFAINLSNALNATFADNQSLAKIVNNDSSVTLALTGGPMAEAGGNITLTATTTTAISADIVVGLAFSGVAVLGTDYSVPDTFITIPAGGLSANLTVTATSDLLDEPNESLIVDIVSVSNAIESGSQQRSTTITDDDAAPTVSFSLSSQNVSEGAASLFATVQLSTVSGQSVTVPFTLAGSAVAGGGNDYTIATPSPITIPAGSSSAQIQLNLINDSVSESSETIQITLSAPTNATLGASTIHTATILDNDRTTISIGDSSATEGNSGSTEMVFTLTRTGDLTPSLAVGYSTSNGTALAGQDYTSIPAGTVTFAAGSPTATITVAISGDVLGEPSEAFSINLTGAIDEMGVVPDLSTAHDFDIADGAYSVVAADINGDGKRDLITANVGSPRISVLLNTTPFGAATPTFAAKVDFTVGNTPSSVAVADINNDGKLDVAVANRTSNSVSVLLNTTAPGSSTASFAARQDLNLGNEPRSVKLGDLNGDGRPDLAVANFSDNSVAVALNTTSPGATTPSFGAKQDFALGSNPLFIALGDLNGDRRTDLVVAKPNGNSIAVLLNSASPGATTASFNAVQSFDTGTNPRGVAIADLNGDGKPDIATANYSSGTSSVFFNTTSPGATAASLTAEQSVSTRNAYNIAIADLNGDGKPDLAATGRAANVLSILPNQTQPGAIVGSFGARQEFATGDGPRGLTVADLNLDGRPDVATADSQTTTVSMLLNTAAITGLSLDYSNTYFTTGNTSSDLHDADLNHDGKIDLHAINRSTMDGHVLINGTSVGSISPSFTSSQVQTSLTNSSAGAIGDFNNDGKIDLLGENNGLSNFSIQLNTTTYGASVATFGAKQTFSTIQAARDVAVADYNLDGRVDLAILDEGGDKVQIRLNTTVPGSSTVSFSAPFDLPVGTTPLNIAAGDLNGDGLIDLVVSNFDGDSISVLVNGTAPGATSPTFVAQQVFAAGHWPEGVALGDINNDGMVDIVVANRAFNRLALFLSTSSPGQATLTFVTREIVVSSGYVPQGVVLTDLNADGRLDIATTDASAGSRGVAIFQNTTLPGTFETSFATRQSFITGTAAFRLVANDFNNDGKLDLAAANANDPTISVFLNSPGVIADGNATGVILDNDLALQVTSLTPTATGFVAQFTQPLELANLNLYDEDHTFGLPDVTLTGSTTGEIRGSLVIDATRRTVTFIKSGGVLPVDSYSVRIKSGVAAFKDTLGQLLDGNLDAVGGDDYTGGFNVAAPSPSAITLSIPDVTRGYGQDVVLPGSTTGIPITISNAEGVKNAAFTLTYDPALLVIDGATVGAGISGTVSLNTSVPGVVVVTVTSTSGLGSVSGAQVLVHLTAHVPTNAPYAGKELLNLSNLQIFDTSAQPVALPGIDDDGLQVAAYFGDANASQSYNAPDATATQRIIVGTNSGLAAYQLIDPHLIVDVTANGMVQSNDVTLIQQAIVGTPTAEIPPLPGLPPVASGGPDPLVSIPQDLTAAVGETFAAPINLLVTEPGGITLAGVDLAVAYDPARFTLTGVTLGDLLVGFGLNAHVTTPGVVRISLTGSSPLQLSQGAAGVLGTLHFSVIAGTGTSSSINLLQNSASLSTALYDDRGRPLTLVPTPTNRDDDEVDGRVQILPVSTPTELSPTAVDLLMSDEFSQSQLAD